MSRLGLAGMVALLAARVAAGQDAAAWRDSTARLAAEMDSLRTRLSNDSTLVQLGSADGVLLVGTAPLRPRAAALLSGFNALRRHWFGAALPGPDGFRLLGRVPVGRGINVFSAWGDRTDERLVLSVEAAGSQAREFNVGVPTGDVAAALAQGYAELMLQALPGSRSLWLINPVPVHMADTERRSLAMYGVITSTGRSGRECVGGNLTSCLYALGLEVAPDDGHTDAFAPLVRADLLAAAIEAGGPGAWQRFADAPREGGVGGALASASGVSRDSLVSGWRRSLLAMRPASSPVSAGWLAVCTGWAMVVVLSTLGVSRWR